MKAAFLGSIVSRVYSMSGRFVSLKPIFPDPELTLHFMPSSLAILFSSCMSLIGVIVIPMIGTLASSWIETASDFMLMVIG